MIVGVPVAVNVDLLWPVSHVDRAVREHNSVASELVASEVKAVPHVPAMALLVVIADHENLVARDAVEHCLERSVVVEDHVAKVDQKVLRENCSSQIVENDLR